MEIEKDKFVEVGRKGNVGEFVYRPSNYPGPIAIDAIPTQPDSSKREDSCEHEWHEEEMRGYGTSIFFCTKCNAEMRYSEHASNGMKEVQ